MPIERKDTAGRVQRNLLIVGTNAMGFWWIFQLWFSERTRTIGRTKLLGASEQIDPAVSKVITGYFYVF